jgi:hypothetical protein
MSALRRAISTLAEDFVSQVLRALHTASLSDLAAIGAGTPARRGPGRPPKSESAAAAAPSAPRGRRGGRRRRTTADLEALGSRVTDLLKSSPSGLRAEAIREALGIARKELPRAISQLLAGGTIRKEGQKRATTYYVGEGSGGAARAASGGAKRGARKGAGKKAGKRGGRAKKAA